MALAEEAVSFELEPVLTAVGPAVVLFPEAKVEVTDCTTWETVIVFVSVAVEVMVVVESAAARPRRRREGRKVVRRILNECCM